MKQHTSLAGCHEVVVYRILPEALDDFDALQSRLCELLESMDGYISRESAPSTDDPCLRIDHVLWRDADSAKAAFEAFPNLEAARELMAAVDGEPVFAGHFRGRAQPAAR